MTEAGPVSYQLDGRIATIAIDDGKANALSIAMLGALHAALDRAERDRAVVVLSGRENYFSGGFDLKVLAAGGEQVMTMLRLGATLSERVLGFPTPVLCACSGHAIAAGTFPLLCADARIGVDGPFRIGLSEVQIGLTVPWFAIEIARQRLHPAHFDRALVSSRMYSPQQAVEAGFLDRVVAASELQAVCRQTALELSELNAEAHTATKLRVRENALSRLRAAISSELEAQTAGAVGAQR